jgi:multidrug efflux pump subunit AcrA (membrane-fusion protein)
MRRTPSVHYTSAAIIRGTIARSITATGTVNPILTIIVGSYVSGVIQSLSCDYNTVVKAGQICAKVDPRPYQATLDQYTGQLLRDRAILGKDRINLARYQKLVAQNSIARQQASLYRPTRRRDCETGRGPRRKRQAQPGLHQYHLASERHGRVPQRDAGPDRRRQLSDPDTVPDRHRP